MRRIAYSPEVRVYIQPNETDEDGKLVDPIDISKDIIEGSIERRTNEISTARFVLQGRRMGKKQNNKDDDFSKENDETTSLLLSRTIRPMDRIVVYLKKTKPILVFSGYIDLAPFVQFVPEPVVIEASCSLKRLKYTYWDPTLPNVMQALIQMGMIVQNNDSGFNVIQPPGQDSTGTGAIEDQGFPKLLSFLLIEVGGWNPETVFIEPLPQEWLDTVEPMFKDLIYSDRTWESAKAFLEAWLGAENTTDNNETNNNGDYGSSSSSAVLENSEEIKSMIDKMIRKYAKNQTDVTGADFVKYGEQYNIDPRFLAAVACAETAYGTTGQGRSPSNGGYYNMYGLGNSGKKMPSRAESIKQSAIQLREKNYYLGDDPSQTVDGWIVNWTQNNQSHLNRVKNFWKEMETPNAKVNFNKPYSIVDQGIGTEISATAGNPSRNSAAGTGTNDRKTLTVYIEAVGSGPDNNKFLKGYQKLDWFARGYTEQSSKNRMAKNIDLAKRVKDRVNEYINTFNELNGVKRDKNKQYDPIDIQIVNHSDVTRGWKGDLYIAIDHSDSERDEDLCYVVTPSGSTPDLINPTVFPAQGDFGSGWQKPSSKYGRDSIKNDKNLRDNSNNFINSLGKTSVKGNPKTSQNGSSLNFEFGKSSFSTKTIAQNAWKGSIPGFFYTAAKGCIYLQLPNKSDDVWIPQTDDWAWHIALALYDYYVNVKLPGNIKQTKAAGNPNIEGTTSTGDDTPASKVIEAALKVVNHNESGKWDIGYSMDDRSPYSDIEDVIKNKGNLDCSSFISACMKSAKLIPKTQYADTTGTLESNSVLVPNKLDFKPGMLFIKTGEGGDGHVAMVVGTDGKCVECTRPDQTKNKGPDRGPQFKRVAKDFIGNPNYRLWRHRLIGDTENPPSSAGGTDTTNDSQNYQDAVNFNRAAFNVAFSFPGSLVDSVLLRGKRALQNDVPLLDSVRDITIGSMRNFASLPNGDFIAWFPDYFNIARRNPWLRISPVEIKKCTIDISDKSLTTHVYIMGNPYGIGNLPSAYSDWYNKLQGAGVVTIEQSGILDSFLYTKEQIDSRKKITNAPDQYETSESAISFLEKYGARPYAETNLTLRHPIIEFFYAYNTFITKWAEQFISRVEFTFMPELFPGMIIEIPNYEQQSHSFSFYVQEVVHTFSYTGGFSTSAILIAPGEVYYDESVRKDPLGLVPVRAPKSVRQPTTYSVAPQKPPTGSPSKKKYKEWLNGRKSTAKLAAEWKKLQGIV